MKEYELRHSKIVRDLAPECTVLLKKDGHFPLAGGGKIALYGNGARHTLMGGTGSGEVNSRHIVTAEEGLKCAGFDVVTKDWLDGYDRIYEKARERFIKGLRVQARRNLTLAVMLGMGRAMREPEYFMPLEGKADTAVYVLSRLSGEGSDRRALPGDLLLTATERRDILECSRLYKNFMLVLNVCGMVDLSGLDGVQNILLLSQLGAETGNILADILLGKSYPSGKLAATWSSWEDYPKIGEFGEKNDTRYREGIYVGYRYFESAGKHALYPFGFGLSYTDFETRAGKTEISGSIVAASAHVKNTGKYNGKEVVQLYITVPEGRQDHPGKQLAAFAKTRQLAPGEEQEIFLSFDMREMASYSEELSAYYLETGDYTLYLGTDCADAEKIGVVRISKELIVRKVKNIFGKPDFKDFVPKRANGVLEANAEKSKPDTSDTTVLELSDDAVAMRKVCYEHHVKVSEKIKKLPDDQLIKLCMGAFNSSGGLSSVIGNAAFTVAGAAGQTSIEAKRYGIPSLVASDGSTGLRLCPEYVWDKRGVHPLGMSMPASYTDLLPDAVKVFLEKNCYKPKKGEKIYRQYATAIPVGSAIAQSFNTQAAEKFGDIVGEEMEIFGVHLWLAPAMNIQRNALCGRNFEYFSEDPLVSGEFAAAMTRGVQSHPHCGVVLKHFAANNQERNRFRSNSMLSERALREVYLRGFEIAIRKSRPKAVMTSYNLINGVHAAEHRGLVEDVLRREFRFKGIVMTDWTIGGFSGERGSRYKETKAHAAAGAGVDLFMPGGKADYDDVKKALKKGTLSRTDLEIHAARVARMAKELYGKRRDEEGKTEDSSRLTKSFQIHRI